MLIDVCSDNRHMFPKMCQLISCVMKWGILKAGLYRCGLALSSYTLKKTDFCFSAQKIVKDCFSALSDLESRGSSERKEGHTKGIKIGISCQVYLLGVSESKSKSQTVKM